MKKLTCLVLAAIMAVTVITVPTFDAVYADVVEEETAVQVEAINEEEVADVVIEGIETQYTYTGKAIKPSPVVSRDGEALVEGKGYEVAYTNNINVGVATVTVTGTGDVQWSKDITFKIVKAKASKVTVTLKYSNYSYTGKKRVPSPTVKMGGKTLKKGKDYTVKYSNNLYPGTATVTVEGINYNFTVKKNFYIAKVGSMSLKSRGVNKLKLGWSKKAGVTGYQIKKYNSSKDQWVTWKTIKDDEVTSAYVGELAAGTSHKFKIRAYVKDKSNKYHYGAYSEVLNTATKPSKAAINSLKTNKKMELKVKWNKRNGSGYQIYVSRSSKFSNPSKYNVTSSSTLSKRIKASKNNQNYYVKVRAYKTHNGKKIYGSWSDVKKIKTDGTGWGTYDGRKYYFKNGTPLKGTHTINGSQYFFGKNSGVLLGTSAKMYETVKKQKSGTKYLISVDRRKNRTVVYHKSKGEWVVKYYWKCCTGAPSDYSSISCTPSGSFTVPKKGAHQKYFGDSHGYRCWYTTRIYKGYLFHSVLYQPYSGSRIQDGRLGYNISHGCVRLSKDNAYWLYKNIEPGTTVEILR